jgi:hypothetical protein
MSGGDGAASLQPSHAALDSIAPAVAFRVEGACAALSHMAAFAGRDDRLGLPRSIALGEVAPGCTGTEPPHEPVHHLPVVPPATAAPPTGTGHEVGNQLPCASLSPCRRIAGVRQGDTHQSNCPCLISFQQPSDRTEMKSSTPSLRPARIRSCGRRRPVLQAARKPARGLPPCLGPNR